MPFEMVLYYAVCGLATYIASTLLFDVVHFILHAMIRSKFAWARAIGSLHQAHHEFWNQNLTFVEAWEKKNLWYHLFPEYLTSIAGSTPFFLVFPWVAVVLSMSLSTVLFVIRALSRGKDSNHKVLDRLYVPKTPVFVGLRYHAHHHVFSDSYFGSMLTLFDRIVGTGCQIRGRRFLVTGASGAFGKPMKELLERHGAAEVVALKYGVDYTYDDYSKVRPLMNEVDVLVLCHGAKDDLAFEANARSFVRFIEMFREVSHSHRAPPEVWAVGSEIETHAAFGAQKYYDSKRAYAKVARWYYGQDSFVYRHIVPSAFTSPMGPGLISGKVAARIALFFIKRGFRYVPVTYTGVAFINYFKFLFRINAKSPTDFARELSGNTQLSPGDYSPIGSVPR